MSEELKQWLREAYNLPATLDDEGTFKKKLSDALLTGKLTVPEWRRLAGSQGDDPRGGPSPDELFGGGSKAGGGNRVNVKRPSERYSHAKSVGKHVRTGQPVRNEHGREVETTSQAEYAKAGALLKYRAMRDGLSVELTEHEKELVAEMLDRDRWCGKLGGAWQTDIDGSRVKSLISDSSSGGAELNPIWFDDMLVSFPLLYGELLPQIDLRPVPRGSSVEGASVGNPSVAWGIQEGTAIGLFDTTSLVAALDTTIFPVTCAVEVGNDLMADSPADLGAVLVENIGQQMLRELEDVIVNGDGTTQPEGIANASGITDIGNPAGGAGADPQVDDYEALLFAVPKQYRRNLMRSAFIANDTTYSRARGIPVSTADARRVFGMDHESYKLLNRDFLIQNDTANNLAIFATLSKYRMYRRQGQEVRFERGGKELALKNLALLIVRGRYGGRVVDANGFAFSDNWKA